MLLRRSREECEISALSIFVNPAQFNDPQDLVKYPRTLERDLQVALRERVDYAFIPDATAMYEDGYRYHVTETAFRASFVARIAPATSTACSRLC